MSDSKSLVFNIQRFSVHDGPGIRTTVFLKGCNLRCKWCHNPESFTYQPDLRFLPDLCIGCGSCFKVCPHNCHTLGPDGEHLIDRSKCDACGKCASLCYAGALIIAGQFMTVDEVMKEVLSDRIYYKNSNGGVTFSGGDPMTGVDFLLELLKASKDEGIHTAVDTAASVPWSTFEKVFPYVDLFLVDLKAATEETHRSLTGVGNGLILENLKKLSEAGARIFIRIPYIPGYNDMEFELMADILSRVKVEHVELLAYHRLGEGKYKSLGMPVPEAKIPVPDKDDLAKAAEILGKSGQHIIYNK